MCTAVYLAASVGKHPPYVSHAKCLVLSCHVTMRINEIALTALRSRYYRPTLQVTARYFSSLLYYKYLCHRRLLLILGLRRVYLLHIGESIMNLPRFGNLNKIPLVISSYVSFCALFVYSTSAIQFQHNTHCLPVLLNFVTFV